MFVKQGDKPLAKLKNGVKKMNFTVKIEKPKALLIEREDGATTWIKKVWMRKDGTLTPAGFKALKNAKTKEEAKHERDEANNRLIGFNPVWESAKAVAVDWLIENPTEKLICRRAFFPKSMCEIDEDGVIHRVPAWLWDKKRQEILEEFAGQNAWFYQN